MIIIQIAFVGLPITLEDLGTLDLKTVFTFPTDLDTLPLYE